MSSDQVPYDCWAKCVLRFCRFYGYTDANVFIYSRNSFWKKVNWCDCMRKWNGRRLQITSSIIFFFPFLFFFCYPVAVTVVVFIFQFVVCYFFSLLFFSFRIYLVNRLLLRSFVRFALFYYSKCHNSQSYICNSRIRRLLNANEWYTIVPHGSHKIRNLILTNDHIN